MTRVSRTPDRLAHQHYLNRPEHASGARILRGRGCRSRSDGARSWRSLRRSRRSPCGRGYGLEDASVDELAIQGGKEAPGHGVTEAIANRSHRAGESCGPAGLGEVVARVLTALVGVVDDDTFRALAGDRHLERPAHQFCGLPGRHRPPEQLPRADVEDDGQEEEARPGRDIGDVGDPALLGRLGREIPIEEVGAGRALSSLRVVRQNFLLVTP